MEQTSNSDASAPPRFGNEATGTCALSMYVLGELPDTFGVEGSADVWDSLSVPTTLTIVP